ncbi:ef hand family protein [Chrysochromulina tobinii]|uniref:Ef hand family protein n=1 Tax=Chrysochromulina tobinii TaxID=1460289 RepID=A0A0M0KCB8_9EUKA|nr:ef hand family protein [Chrysochromulina tobinii]|eukprot:KOO36058.1 ef hand family protein [Chrysochromulina sp. CCMP291]
MGCASSTPEDKHVGFDGVSVGSGHRSKSSDDLAHGFKKDAAALSEALEQELRSFFDAMDGDKNGEVSKDEAIAFWGKNFAKVNATAMFNEVDEDKSATITWDEFLAFWRNVVASGYSEDDLKEEVEMMKAGGSWVDFNDGRTT